MHTLQSSFKVGAAGLLAAIAVIGFSKNAEARHADGSSTVIALDLDFAAPVDEPKTDPGGGAAVRVGRKYRAPLISITPEVGGGYHDFGGDSRTRLYRGFLGGRLGLGRIIEPSAYAHLGVGKLDYHIGGRFAPVVDAGLALDFTGLPWIDLGVHGAYNAVLPNHSYPNFDWLSFGLHAALVF